MNSETESVLSGSLEYEYNYTKGNDVGNYTITPKGLSSGNYDITFVPGTLTVTQADPSYSYTGTLTATYGQTLADVAFSTSTSNPAF